MNPSKSMFACLAAVHILEYEHVLSLYSLSIAESDITLCGIAFIQSLHLD